MLYNKTIYTTKRELEKNSLIKCKYGIASLDWVEVKFGKEFYRCYISVYEPNKENIPFVDYGVDENEPGREGVVCEIIDTEKQVPVELKSQLALKIVKKIERVRKGLRQKSA